MTEPLFQHQHVLHSNNRDDKLSSDQKKKKNLDTFGIYVCQDGWGGVGGHSLCFCTYPELSLHFSLFFFFFSSTYIYIYPQLFMYMPASQLASLPARV